MWLLLADERLAGLFEGERLAGLFEGERSAGFSTGTGPRVSLAVSNK